MKRTLLAASAAVLLAGSGALAGAGMAAATSGPAAPAAAAGDPVDAVLADATTSLTDLDDTAAADGRLGTRGLDRMKARCDRIPQALTRLADARARLAGDASTRGSLAALQQRADRAEAAGKADLAAALTDRLAVRKDVQALLPGRVSALKALQGGLCVDVAKALASSAKAGSSRHT